MTTYPTLRQRIRLADAIVLADGWRAGDAWRDELDDHERTLSLVTVRPTWVLKGEPDERVTLLTDRERLAAVFDTSGAVVLVLRHDPLLQRYVLLFGTVLPVDGDRILVPEDMADDACRAGMTLDDLAALVAEDQASAAGNAQPLTGYEADVVPGPMPAPTELAGADDVATGPPTGPRCVEPDQPE